VRRLPAGRPAARCGTGHGLRQHLVTRTDALNAAAAGAEPLGRTGPRGVRDDSLEDAAGLADPDIIATEIVEDLRAALEEFELIAADLG